MAAVAPRDFPRLRPGEARRTAAWLLALCAVGPALSAPAQASAATGVAWGLNRHGMLGTESNVGPDICGLEACSQVPVAVDGLANLVQISGGEYHTLGLLSNGTVLAWGYNQQGELGDGSTEESLVPVPVSGLSNVVQVAGSSESSLALLSNGTVMAWGNNSIGELGGGSTEGPETCGATACSRVPRQVPGISGAVAIAAGYYYNLALLSDGTVLMWGNNRFGINGDGKGDLGADCECIPAPTPVAGVSGAVAISAAPSLAMALLADGTVRDWGYNVHGQLGNGTANPLGAGCECLPPVQVSGLSGAREVAASDGGGYAVTGDGSVKAWGANGSGELGIGSTSGPETCNGEPCSRTPVTVHGINAPVAIDAGTRHVLAELPDGTVRAWGLNIFGALGNESVNSADLPGPVTGLTVASAVTADFFQSFALVGTAQTLAVAVAGAGSGVVGGSAGILCPAACTARLTQGAFETMRAEPAPGSGFAGFSGACAGTGPCHVAMGQDQQVTATFGPPAGTKITKARVNSRKRSARFSFTAPGAITGFQCELIRPKPRHRKHRSARRLERAKPRFSACGPATKAYKHLLPGRYTFKVRALDILGADPNPATKVFRIKRVRRHHRP